MSLKTIAAVIVALCLAACASSQKKSSPDLYANSVKITNVAANHGGTGIVLRSSDTASLILTNAHVCGVVEQGGLVTGRAGQFMVTDYKKSEKFDLCLIKVAGDLEASTRIANRPPVLQYEKATISGHPALYPNVQTHGHFSGRAVIPILVGIKPCTVEDAQDPNKGAACFFLGGLPIIKEYESVLVTATIMPGSSGSGVYNKDGELSGVVFAGSGQLGYAWTMPYEAVKNFLGKEARHLAWQKPTNEVDLFGGKSEARETEVQFMTNLKKVCESPFREVIGDLCQLADQDILK